MKLRELRKMTRLDPFSEWTEAALIDNAARFTGKGKGFFERIANALKIEGEKEMLKELNALLRYGGDGDLCIMLNFIAALRGEDSLPIRNCYLTGGRNVLDMELKDSMDYGLSGGDHFYLLIAIKWSESSLLIKRGYELEIRNIWDVLKY